MAGKWTYKVTLTDEERDLLRSMLSSGKAAAGKLNHACLLLFADEVADGLRRTDQEIAATLGRGPPHPRTWQLAEHGRNGALHPGPPMSGSPPGCEEDSPKGGRCLGDSAQPGENHHQLAFRDR